MCNLMLYSFILSIVSTKLGAMNPVIVFCLLFLSTRISITKSDTNSNDVTAIMSLKALWQNVPPSWSGFPDPCGRRWQGIICNGSRVIAITLASMKLEGRLSGDIQELTELQILDLSYNKGLSGPLPSAIGKLTKLTNLILVGCNFNGQLPDTIGSLSQLRFLYMNSNSFSGRIPNSIGNLSKLYWLDLGENKLTGTLPVSNGTTPGLDMLVNTKHFHFGRNQLSGSIPPQLLHENMTILHLLLDNNQLTGNIPSTLGLVKTLEVVRLDWNSISGSVPSNISNLTSVTDLLFSNNQLTGLMPNLTGMSSLNYLDISNNSFEASDFPSWITALSSLTDLIMEGTQIQGMVLDTLFSLPHLQQVFLKKNGLDGRLDIGEAHSTELRIIDMQNNNISAYTHRPGDNSFQLILIENPVCDETTDLQSYCGITQESKPSYTTPQNCARVACNANEFSSPNCKCANPYTGNFVFRAPHFSNLQNFSYYTALEQKLMDTFNSYKLPVDSVSLSNLSRDTSNYLGITLQIFPLDQGRFNRTAISILGFLLSNQTFKPPPIYGTCYFTANEYTIFADEPASKQKKALSMAAIIGIAAVGSSSLLILLCAGITICYCRKRPAKSEEPTYPLGITPVSPWTSPGINTSPLQLSGSRLFTLDEVKKITDNFAAANDIGSGAFGKVYRGMLVDGQLVAVKRANHESRHGGNQFRAEIELLTRVHHTNLVRLLGFCIEKGELILVYEYVPNGNLKESLSGKSGVRLDWKRRIKVALGTARGLSYLHQLANPPIVHRDIKSNNILLDENLNAKVSDFGLSKPLIDVGKSHITTEVKGTMGYLDPEYYYTQKLNEKSDVYSFGVLMLEVITGKSPLVRGKYVVSEVKNVIDRTQDLYGLHEVLDSGIIFSTSLKGIEKYVDLALRCVEESGTNRPDMGEVVKQLEDILEMAGLNPYIDSGGSSGTFDQRNVRHFYRDESLYSHNGALPR
ncbi:probable leucine-rich repeat receptor-like protein kinase At5g49770 [Chenopodium quinoa]|uniref:probable leucine-rich repeat receptor-like protein kinase At5g49770 n=1 Tax=Chenopodium quinoa TaxID=63459 RepID=UPI000B785B9E|nr:probable leucine-rich repeat receptor-like protein kinase At5g49770 [Chenopodium quinoa]